MSLPFSSEKMKFCGETGVLVDRNRGDFKESPSGSTIYKDSLIRHLLVYISESGLTRTRGHTRAVRTISGRWGLTSRVSRRSPPHTVSFLPNFAKEEPQLSYWFNFWSWYLKLLGDVPAIIIFDNAPRHRGAWVAVIRSHHTLRFLPYSQFLNIVKNFWSFWKSSFKAGLTWLGYGSKKS